MAVSEREERLGLDEIANLSFPERAKALAQLAEELEEELESLDGEHAPPVEDERSPRR